MSGNNDPTEIEVGIEQIQVAFSRLRLVVDGWAEGARSLAADGVEELTLRVPAFSFDERGHDLWRRGPSDPYSSGCGTARMACDDLNEMTTFLTAYCECLAALESESS